MSFGSSYQDFEMGVSFVRIFANLSHLEQNFLTLVGRFSDFQSFLHMLNLSMKLIFLIVNLFQFRND
jgi:hypothetical protein